MTDGRIARMSAIKHPVLDGKGRDRCLRPRAQPGRPVALLAHQDCPRLEFGKQPFRPGELTDIGVDDLTQDGPEGPDEGHGQICPAEGHRRSRELAQAIDDGRDCCFGALGVAGPAPASLHEVARQQVIVEFEGCPVVVAARLHLPADHDRFESGRVESQDDSTEIWVFPAVE